MRSLSSCTWWFSPLSVQPGSARPFGDNRPLCPKETASNMNCALAVLASSHGSSVARIVLVGSDRSGRSASEKSNGWTCRFRSTCPSVAIARSLGLSHRPVRAKRSPEAQVKSGKIWTVVQQAPLPVYFLFSPIDALTACTVLTAIHPNTTKPTIFLTSVTMLTTDSEA